MDKRLANTFLTFKSLEVLSFSMIKFIDMYFMGPMPWAGYIHIVQCGYSQDQSPLFRFEPMGYPSQVNLTADVLADAPFIIEPPNEVQIQPTTSKPSRENEEDSA